jgi:hypothetical protein
MNAHHHHHPGHAHPPPARMSPSILRASAAQRLLAAGVCAGLLWLAVFWAVH